MKGNVRQKISAVSIKIGSQNDCDPIFAILNENKKKKTEKTLSLL